MRLGVRALRRMTLEVVVVPGVEGSTLQTSFVFLDLRGMVDFQLTFGLLKLSIADRSCYLIQPAALSTTPLRVSQAGISCSC